MLVKIKDESVSGKIRQEIFLEFRSRSVTIREIICERVEQEVANFNQKMPEYYNGLVEPFQSQTEAKGYRMKPNTKIDPEQQTYIALDAFQKNGFFVLVDNIQAESLDQVVELEENTSISFIKLTPLVGG